MVRSVVSSRPLRTLTGVNAHAVMARAAVRPMNAQSRAVAICAFVCGVGLACTTTTDLSRDLGPVPDGSLMTDATGYVAHVTGIAPPAQEFQFTVIARFENRSAAAVFLARCFPTSPQPIYAIVTADGSATEVAYNPDRACVGHSNQFQILPGAVRVDTFLVRGPNAFDEIKQQAIGVTSGEFRFDAVRGKRSGRRRPSAPGSLGISNAFVVRTAN